MSTLSMLAASVVGLINDAIIGLYLLASIAFIGIVTNHWRSLQSHLVTVLLIVSVLLVAIQLFADGFLWFEFSSRSNRLIFHYLNHPKEVLEFLQEQLYLWYWVVPLVIAISLTYRKLRAVIARKWLESSTNQTYSSAILLCFVSIIYLVSSSVVLSYHGSYQPFQSRILNQYAGNGLINILHIMQIDVENWSDGYPQLTDAQLQETLTKHHDQQTHQLIDSHSNNSHSISLDDIKHVVLIIEESFAGDYWSNPKLRQRYMPNFSRWAKQGMLFDNTFATGTRTTRGLEAIFNGYPPLPGIALNQRDVVNQLPSLPKVFKQHGYDTWFVYSGWPNFSNFSNYWQTLGFENIITRNDFDSSLFHTSWGFADEYLFERIIDVMDEQTQQSNALFLSTLTVSNHRPYEVPETSLTFTENRVLQNGIEYADKALGDFLDKASTKPWFNNTLFVIVADHGPRIKGHATIPANSMHVPLLLLSPAHLPSNISKQLTSTMDIAKSLTHVLGLNHNQLFWGNNIFDPADTSKRYALMEHEYHLGILQNNNQLTVIPYRKASETWLFKQANHNAEATKVSTDINSSKRLNALMQQAHQRLYPQ